MSFLKFLVEDSPLHPILHAAGIPEYTEDTDTGFYVEDVPGVPFLYLSYVAPRSVVGIARRDAHEHAGLSKCMRALRWAGYRIEAPTMRRVRVFHPPEYPAR